MKETFITIGMIPVILGMFMLLPFMKLADWIEEY